MVSIQLLNVLNKNWYLHISYYNTSTVLNSHQILNVWDVLEA